MIGKADAVTALVRRYVAAIESGEPWDSGQLAQEIRKLPGLAPRLKKGWGVSWRRDGDGGYEATIGKVTYGVAKGRYGNRPVWFATEKGCGRMDALGHFESMREAQRACEGDAASSG